MNLAKSTSVSLSVIVALFALELNADSIYNASKILPKTQAMANVMPNFGAISDVKTKKRQFFSFLLPMIRDSNREILSHRELLLEIRDLVKNEAPLTDSIRHFVGGLSRRYKVNLDNDLLAQIHELLLKVDVVPESLVLAQAANESGWGTSRFAQEANNLFGIWCFTPGCGLTPLSRDEGLTHEVARYGSVTESIEAYMHTINTNPAYIDLRQIRAETRGNADVMNGLTLAEGLINYSARGSDYVKEIQQLIRVNKLQEFNLPV